MKSYILNLTTYGMNGQPLDYDYTTAAAIWNECDELNETLRFHTVTLTETVNGSLILSAEPTGTESTVANGHKKIIPIGSRTFAYSHDKTIIIRMREKVAQIDGTICCSQTDFTKQFSVI